MILTRKSFFILNLLLLLLGNRVNATTITANGNGSWGTSGSWSLGRKPTCGDTIVIPAGITITVNAQENLVPCGNPVTLYVHGTLQFTNGNKIDFPCGSWVYIAPGGVIKKSTAGGGNSTLISICGYVEWNAGDGQINGPDTLGGHGSLPVSWLSFSASMKEKMVELTWSTAVEINNDFFDLVRSDDGINYKSIGKIGGNGNSTVVNFYTFLDTDPEPGISYYRLLQVDYDGKQNPSDIVAVFNSAGFYDITEVHLSPNPVTSEAKVVFNSRQGNSAIIEIKNANGQICLSQTVSTQKGFNTCTIGKIEGLAKGVYTVVVTTASGASKPFGLIKK
jgi:hypothetical protein